MGSGITPGVEKKRIGVSLESVVGHEVFDGFHEHGFTVLPPSVEKKEALFFAGAGEGVADGAAEVVDERDVVFENSGKERVPQRGDGGGVKIKGNGAGTIVRGAVWRKFASTEIEGAVATGEQEGVAVENSDVGSKGRKRGGERDHGLDFSVRLRSEAPANDALAS